MIVVKKKNKPVLITLESKAEISHMQALCDLYSGTSEDDEEGDILETTNFAEKLEKKLRQKECSK